MLIMRHDTQNGFVLPEARWAAYVEGLVAQFHRGCSNIDVTVGSDYPLLVLRQFVKHGSISISDILIYDVGIESQVAVDNDGCFIQHSTIGEDRNQLMFALF